MANKIISQEDMNALHSHFDAIIEIMLRIGESDLTYRKGLTPYSVQLRELPKKPVTVLNG